MAEFRKVNAVPPSPSSHNICVQPFILSTYKFNFQSYTNLSLLQGKKPPPLIEPVFDAFNDGTLLTLAQQMKNKMGLEEMKNVPPVIWEMLRAYTRGKQHAFDVLNEHQRAFFKEWLSRNEKLFNNCFMAWEHRAFRAEGHSVANYNGPGPDTFVWEAQHGTFPNVLIAICPSDVDGQGSTDLRHETNVNRQDFIRWANYEDNARHLMQQQNRKQGQYICNLIAFASQFGAANIPWVWWRESTE